MGQHAPLYMKTYFSNLIPRIQSFSEKLDNLAYLTNKHWVVIDDIDSVKCVYIFRPNNELLISRDGKVEKAKWEYLGHNSLLIDVKNESYLFKHGFFDDNILALKIDSKDEYAFLVNESKFDTELNTLTRVDAFLNAKYIDSPKSQLGVNHRAPNYKIVKVTEHVSIFKVLTRIYEIEYEDGEKGEVYLKTNSQAYFKDRFTYVWSTLVHNYVTEEKCINGFHYFLKTGNILRDGFISTA